MKTAKPAKTKTTRARKPKKKATGDVAPAQMSGEMSGSRKLSAVGWLVVGISLAVGAAGMIYAAWNGVRIPWTDFVVHNQLIGALMGAVPAVIVCFVLIVLTVVFNLDIYKSE